MAEGAGSANAERIGQDSDAQHRSAIDAVTATGARRVVSTSRMGASATSHFYPMQTHARTEALVRHAGITWTSVRNESYAEAVPTMMVGDAGSTGVLAALSNGRVAWTTDDDLAAGVAAEFAKGGCFDGPTPPLTASEALDLADMATILAGIHGRPIRREVIEDEALAAGMQAEGVPSAIIEISLGLYRAARAGEFAATNPTLETLIGKPPSTLRTALATGGNLGTT